MDIQLQQDNVTNEYLPNWPQSLQAQTDINRNSTKFGNIVTEAGTLLRGMAHPSVQIQELMRTVFHSVYTSKDLRLRANNIAFMAVRLTIIIYRTLWNGFPIQNPKWHDAEVFMA